MIIIGHQAIQDRLIRLSTHEEHPQSFLFAGPESVGKRVVALRFAWELIGQGEAFLDRAEDELLHPDIAWLVPERITEKGKTREKGIPVETVRESLVFLSRYPLVGKKRILIIDDAHKLSHGAQNALLKTLEEPNATSVLILVTHDASMLLETVCSRVQRINFSCVPECEMHDCGEIGQENTFLFSLGRPGVIRMMMRDTEEFEKSRILLGRLFALTQGTLAERLRLAEDMAQDSALALRLLGWWIPSVRYRAFEISDQSQICRIFFFLEAGSLTEKVLRSTQAHTRLQLEKLFLSI